MPPRPAVTLSELPEVPGVRHRDVRVNGVRLHVAEAGEGPLHPVIPAISNAIYDAVGVRLKELPFHPGKLLKALHQKRAGRC